MITINKSFRFVTRSVCPSPAKETIVCACSKYLRDKFKIVLETQEAVFEGVEFYTLTLTGKDSAQI